MSQLSTSELKCEKCGTPLAASSRNCTTCNADAGFPNVRSSCTEENLNALSQSYEEALVRATSKGVLSEFATLSGVTENESGVVVAMTGTIALTLLKNPETIYSNYENLTRSGTRKPAREMDDRHRLEVGALIFGSYSNEIRYGVLSLTTAGLPTYGDVFCRLRNVAVANRTSFLETNSFEFVRSHNIGVDDEIPAGYRAQWQDRHKLALAKLGDRLTGGQSKTEFQDLLVESDGKDRNNDSFIEAHIFGGFDKNAIESLEINTEKTHSRTDQLLLDVVTSTFAEMGVKIG